MDKESLFDEIQLNVEINKGIMSLSELNEIEILPVNEPVIVMALTEDLSNITVPQSVAVPAGSESVAPSAITNPIEDPARNAL